MSDQVHYHQHGREPLVLHIVKKHDDGTVDLAREQKGKPIIEGIALSDAPGHGKAVLIEPETKKAKSKAKAPEKTADNSGDSKDTKDNASDNGTGDAGSPPPPEE